MKRTKIPKLEPIRSRLPAFPDPTRHEFRLSLRIRRVVRQPLPNTLVHSRRVFFGSRFREVGFTTPRAPRPAYPHAPHLRKSHPTSQWLPLPCLWPLSRPPSSARTSPPSRAPASPRSRPRRWLAAAPPSRYEHRRCAPARTEPGRRTPPARRSRERARLPTRASIETRARPRRRRRVDPAHARRHRIARRLEKREPSHRSRVQRVSRAGEDMPRIAPRASRGDREIPSAHAATRAALVAASAARVVRPSPRARPGARPREARAPRAPRPALYPLAAVWSARWHSDPARRTPVS